METPEAVLRERTAWNRIVGEWYHGNPMMSMEHHQAWLAQVIARGLRMKYVKVSAAGMPVAYFPLLQGRSFRRVRARRLEFPEFAHTGPILNVECQSAVLDYFCRSVLPTLSWDVLVWRRVAPEPLPPDLLTGAFRTAGYLVCRGAGEGNWVYVGEKAGFQTYLTSRGPSTRYEVRRAPRRLKTENFEVRVFRNEDCLDRLPDYHRVLARSWKSADPNPDYIREMVRHLGAVGQFRLAFLLMNGTPVATQLWLISSNGRAYAHTFAHDEAFKSCSPGKFLMTRMLQIIMDEDDVSRVDFLLGDEPYKRQWSNRRQELHNFALFPPTGRGRALHALDQHLLPFVRSNRRLRTLAKLVMRDY
jgi:hypothetical protein